MGSTRVDGRACLLCIIGLVFIAGCAHCDTPTKAPSRRLKGADAAAASTQPVGGFTQPGEESPGAPPTPLECLPIGFLHKTHTITNHFLEAAKLAKRQVETCRGYYRAVYIVTHTGPNNASQGVEALRRAVGDEAVIAIGPAELSLAFGKAWDELVTITRQQAKHKEFGWVHCDAAELTWFQLFSIDLPRHIQHVWVAEYDFGWTGDLPYILSVFPPAADFICSTDYKSHGIFPGKHWAWSKLRNWLSGDEVRSCFVMLVRYSLRLLRTFAEQTRMGNLQYCEMTGATLCVKHGLWCKLHTFDQHHALVGRSESGEVLYRWDTDISPQEWQEITSRAPSGPSGHLYHALKW